MNINEIPLHHHVHMENIIEMYEGIWFVPVWAAILHDCEIPGKSLGRVVKGNICSECGEQIPESVVACGEIMDLKIPIGTTESFAHGELGGKHTIYKWGTERVGSRYQGHGGFE